MLMERGFIDADEIAAGHALRPGKSRPRPVHIGRYRKRHPTRLVSPARPGACQVRARRSRAHEEHPPEDTHTPAALRARPRGRGRASARHHVFPDSVAAGQGESAMALHGELRCPRTLGRGRRSDLEGFGRGVRALSGACLRWRRVSRRHAPREPRQSRHSARCGRSGLPRTLGGARLRHGAGAA